MYASNNKLLLFKISNILSLVTRHLRIFLKKTVVGTGGAF